MATEDVIELGSSDDEAEPAPKKVKCIPNAMVHIPNKLPGVTIKPAKPCPPPIQQIMGKGITVKKVTPEILNFNLNKRNGKTTSKPLLKTNPKNAVRAPVPLCIPIKSHIKPNKSSKGNINPLSLMSKLSNSQIIINKVQPNKGVIKYPLKVQSPQTLNSLPSAITVTKTNNRLESMKRLSTATISNVKKKQKVHRGAPRPVVTVELDDDNDPLESAPGPQWYIRPEEQKEQTHSEAEKKQNTLEAENNKEPESSKMIEITIEDSPIKPPNKRTHEVGAEFAITIDDSPVKPKEKNALNGSDDENNTDKEKTSKKKLEYPKADESCEVRETIEIEIEPITTEVSIVAEEEASDRNKVTQVIRDAIVEIEDSPIKIVTDNSTPKKNDKRSQILLLTKKSENIFENKKSNDSIDTMKQIEETKESNNDMEAKTSQDAVEVVPSDKKSGEFHPVYQSFIDLCLKLENSEDMTKIVEKKIKSYYRQVSKEYTESEDFIDMVSNKIILMKAGPEKLYLYIKDIVDELNFKRKTVKTLPQQPDAESTESNIFLYGEDSGFDMKRQRQIHKLEKTLKKLHRAIQKLEEQDVDFDDEEDSVYLLTERYKERMVRVHAKLCQLTNSKMPSEPRVQMDARPGRPSGAAKRLEKWINKKVPIGTPLPFPDFHDVLRCVRVANEEDKLGWNEADIMEEARDLFTRCGKKLQRRRQENEWRLAASRLTANVDPAEENEELKRKLEENRKVATKKETDVFNKYADRQNQLKLEAEEIGDKEAEESPAESEEDDSVEESLILNNKEKRKERLRRLLSEKSNKTNTLESEQKPSDAGQDVEVISSDVENDKLNEDTPESVNKDTETAGVPDAKESKEIQDRVHSISDDDDNVESDASEFNLLVKLNSGNEINTSSIDSSDSIGFSDDNKRKINSDVISIENSSYSESESENTNKDDDGNAISLEITLESSPDSQNPVEIDLEKADIEIGSSSTSEKQHPSSNNDDAENILLASDDDENECVNLRDDSFYIEETDIPGENSPDTLDSNDKVQELPTEKETEIRGEKTADDNKSDCSSSVRKEMSFSSVNCVEKEINRTSVDPSSRETEVDEELNVKENINDDSQIDESLRGDLMENVIKENPEAERISQAPQMNDFKESFNESEKEKSLESNVKKADGLKENTTNENVNDDSQNDESLTSADLIENVIKKIVADQISNISHIHDFKDHIEKVDGLKEKDNKENEENSIKSLYEIIEPDESQSPTTSISKDKTSSNIESQDCADNAKPNSFKIIDDIFNNENDNIKNTNDT